MYLNCSVLNGFRYLECHHQLDEHHHCHLEEDFHLQQVVRLQLVDVVVLDLGVVPSAAVLDNFAEVVAAGTEHTPSGSCMSAC